MGEILQAGEFEQLQRTRSRAAAFGSAIVGGKHYVVEHAESTKSSVSPRKHGVLLGGGPVERRAIALHGAGVGHFQPLQRGAAAWTAAA